MIFYDILDILWYSMIFYDILWYSMIFYDILWYSIWYPWYSMIGYIDLDLFIYKYSANQGYIPYVHVFFSLSFKDTLGLAAQRPLFKNTTRVTTGHVDVEWRASAEHRSDAPSGAQRPWPPDRSWWGTAKYLLAMATATVVVNLGDDNDYIYIYNNKWCIYSYVQYIYICVCVCMSSIYVYIYIYIYMYSIYIYILYCTYK